MSLIIFGIIALNLFISWWNCRACGLVWNEAQRFGGFMKALVWSGAIQSIVGFSSAFVVLLAFIAYATGHLPQLYVQKVFDLWYLLVIFPALGSGLIITIHSLIQAYRERNLASIGTAAWNTLAQVSNMYSAVEGIPRAFDSVGELFSSKGDSDDRKAALVLLLVVLAIAGGAIVTFALIKHYARRAMPSAEQVTA